MLSLRAGSGTFVLGLCGPQGSGKSTLAQAFARWLREARGLSAVVLSLDDLYLSRRAREDLAERVHPLLRTRGVPGTHDVAAGVALIARLTSAGADDRTLLPRFDKARDAPQATQGPEVRGRPDVVIFEGWCVGARPQAQDALVEPVNALERECDADGRWRRWVNAELATRYRPLFAPIDRLALLAPSSFEPVLRWRREQEHALAAALAAEGRPRDDARAMDDAAVERFVMHYERLTRHILREMPPRADLVVALDDSRRIVATTNGRTDASGRGEQVDARGLGGGDQPFVTRR